PCHLPQARAHDGRRCDRDERTWQRLGVYGATAWRRDTLIKAAMVPTETCDPMSALGQSASNTSRHVRFAPIATKVGECDETRFVPMCDSCAATIDSRPR